MAVVRAEPGGRGRVEPYGLDRCLRRWLQLRSEPRVCDDRMVVAAVGTTQISTWSSAMAVRFASVTFDCADAHRVARFWSAAVGRPLDPQASARFA